MSSCNEYYCLDRIPLGVRIAAHMHLLPSHFPHSIFVVLLITALHPMYLGPPTNTPEIIRTVIYNPVPIVIVVAFAVVIAVVTLAAALKNTNPNYQHKKTYS